MLDSDLAKLYGVPTRRLNEQVRRNIDRFPEDFMFQLTAEEARALRSQDATSKPGRGGRRYAPLVFTEQGVAMLSSVLRSEEAVEVNIEIMRAFVRVRVVPVIVEQLHRRVDTLRSSTAPGLGKFSTASVRSWSRRSLSRLPPTARVSSGSGPIPGRRSHDAALERRRSTGSVQGHNP